MGSTSASSLHFVAGDAAYAVPALPWITDTFLPWASRRLFGWSLFKWAPTFDCNHLACVLHGLALVCYGQGRSAGDPDGLSLGEVHYMKDMPSGSQSHSIVWAATTENNAPDSPIILAFFDRRPDQRVVRVYPSPAEKRTMRFAYA